MLVCMQMNRNDKYSMFCFYQMAVEFLHEINVPFFKVASADTNNIPYLDKTAQKGEILHPKYHKTYPKLSSSSSRKCPHLCVFCRSSHGDLQRYAVNGNHALCL